MDEHDLPIRATALEGWLVRAMQGFDRNGPEAWAWCWLTGIRMGLEFEARDGRIAADLRDTLGDEPRRARALATDLAAVDAGREAGVEPEAHGDPHVEILLAAVSGQGIGPGMLWLLGLGVGLWLPRSDATAAEVARAALAARLGPAEPDVTAALASIPTGQL